MNEFEKEYEMSGERIVVEGVAYYSQGYCTDGCDYGYAYKNKKAFTENPDEVCYIPEHSFDDAEVLVIDGIEYSPESELDCYTRRDLERLLSDCDIHADGEDEWVSVEFFFDSLFWCYPETRLNELTD